MPSKFKEIAPNWEGKALYIQLMLDTTFSFVEKIYTGAALPHDSWARKLWASACMLCSLVLRHITLKIWHKGLIILSLEDSNRHLKLFIVPLPPYSNQLARILHSLEERIK